MNCIYIHLSTLHKSQTLYHIKLYQVHLSMSGIRTYLTFLIRSVYESSINRVNGILWKTKWEVDIYTVHNKQKIIFPPRLTPGFRVIVVNATFNNISVIMYIKFYFLLSSCVFMWWSTCKLLKEICWILNAFNQCLSPLTCWVRIPLKARCTWYNIMW
jgi:hypothetical protein